MLNGNVNPPPETVTVDGKQTTHAVPLASITEPDDPSALSTASTRMGDPSSDVWNVVGWDDMDEAFKKKMRDASAEFREDRHPRAPC